MKQVQNLLLLWIRSYDVILEAESNRTNFELIFIKFFELFFTFSINRNRIINFRIESNEFQTNSNLTPPLGKGSATSDFVVIHAWKGQSLVFGHAMSFSHFLQIKTQDFIATNVANFVVLTLWSLSNKMWTSICNRIILHLTK